MPNPGFTFGTISATGVLQEVSWGVWGQRIQKAGAFGVEGESVLHGGRTTRELSFNLTLTGYGSAAALETAIQNYESFLGAVATLQLRVGGGTVISTETNVLFKGLERMKSGFDAVHSYYRHCRWTFEQLSPQ
jgi:hypothetical protein